VGKSSRRPGRAARDIHAAIRDHAAALKATPRPGFRDADELPEVAALLSACRAAVEAAIPSAVVFEGRRYFVAARLMVAFDVFDSAGAAEPLIRGASASFETVGHRPGH
jgi:hypothetical protein